MPKKNQPKQALADSVAQDWAHQHTVTINSKRRVLEFEASEVEGAIAALSTDLANQRRKKATLEAMIRGLTSVVAKR
ncbi:MAG: hypothetical protein V4529_17125 [Gemmatimonadota bacterium]